jgi:phosphopantothenoylcysteine decarboxylase/phosphopantothenate--cysteine ligase
VQQLIADGVTVLGPVSGVQACGEEGMGRMLEAEELENDILVLLQYRDSLNTASLTLALSPRERGLNGLKVLITAGPTYEAIDAVRGITNRSSGKMGYAIAQAAQEMGAQVMLVSGPTALQSPSDVRVTDVTSAAEMFEAVKQNVGDADIFISVAAVADYRVSQTSAQKIKKHEGNLILELVPNPDILAYVAALPDAPFCVGFAAESERLSEYAEKKRRAKKLPLLAANLAQHAIGADDNEITLFYDAGEHRLPRADKLTLARALLLHAANLYQKGKLK